jgi:hypothetical protein
MDKLFWKTKDGTTIALKNMTDTHIKAALKRLQDKGFQSNEMTETTDKWGGCDTHELYTPWVEHFEEELKMREMARRHKYYLDRIDILHDVNSQ